MKHDIYNYTYTCVIIKGVTYIRDVMRVSNTALERDGLTLGCLVFLKCSRLRELFLRPDDRRELLPNLSDEYLQ